MQGLEAAAVAADTELVGGFGVQAEVHAHDFLLLGDPEAHGLVDGRAMMEVRTAEKTMAMPAAASWAHELGEAAAVEEAAADTVGRGGR